MDEQYLFNFNDDDMSQAEEVQDMLDSSVEKVPTEDPYWILPSSELSSFLQLASLFSWRSGRDLTSKSVSLTTSSDKFYVECRATDFDNYLLYRIPITVEKPIPQCLIFPTATLLKIIKLCPKTFIIKQGEGSPCALILGQWVELESLILDPSLYLNNDPIQTQGQFYIPKLLTNLIPIVSSAVIPKDRNLYFYPSTLQCTYLWATLQVNSSTPVPFILSAREASLLKVLSNGIITVGLTESDLPRLSLSTEQVNLLIIYRKPESSYTSLDFPDFSLEVDPASLYSLVQLSETLPSSSGILQFQYNQSEGMIITYCSKLSNTVYNIPCNIQGTPTELNPSMLQTKILKQLLKPLGNSVIKLSWSTSTLFIQSGDVKLSILFET